MYFDLCSEHEFQEIEEPGLLFDSLFMDGITNNSQPTIVNISCELLENISQSYNLNCQSSKNQQFHNTTFKISSKNHHGSSKQKKNRICEKRKMQTNRNLKNIRNLPTKCKNPKCLQSLDLKECSMREFIMDAYYNCFLCG